MLAALVLAMAFACGWFGRGWWDGSTVSTETAASQAQDFVSAAAESTTRIDRAEGNAQAQRERTRERIKYVEVDKGCPPGTGAVSGDMRDRLFRAFGPPPS